MEGSTAGVVLDAAEGDEAEALDWAWLGVVLMVVAMPIRAAIDWRRLSSRFMGGLHPKAHAVVRLAAIAAGWPPGRGD